MIQAISFTSPLKISDLLIALGHKKHINVTSVPIKPIVIVWAFVMAQLTFRSLCNALQRVHVSLMTASQSYDPETYQIVQLLEAMKPAVPIPGILVSGLAQLEHNFSITFEELEYMLSL